MKEFVSWNLIDECVTDIAFHIRDIDIVFEGVYGIPRGGSLLAVMLSHKLDITYITDFRKVDDGDIIVIDDIVDTGKTFQFYKEQLKVFLFLSSIQFFKRISLRFYHLLRRFFQNQDSFLPFLHFNIKVQ